MNDRILELAKQADMDTMWDFTPGFTRRLESFYKLAHADGQRAMRERAAKEAKQLLAHWSNESVSASIRNLEITNGES